MYVKLGLLLKLIALEFESFSWVTRAF